MLLLRSSLLPHLMSLAWFLLHLTCLHLARLSPLLLISRSRSLVPAPCFLAAHLQLPCSCCPLLHRLPPLQVVIPRCSLTYLLHPSSWHATVFFLLTLLHPPLRSPPALPQLLTSLFQLLHALHLILLVRSPTFGLLAPPCNLALYVLVYTWLLPALHINQHTLIPMLLCARLLLVMCSCLLRISPLQPYIVFASTWPLLTHFLLPRAHLLLCPVPKRMTPTLLSAMWALVQDKPS